MHSAIETKDSVNETNMHHTETDLDNSDDDYVEEAICEASTANRDTMLDGTATDIQSSINVFTPGEGRIPVFSEGLAEYLPSPQFSMGM